MSHDQSRRTEYFRLVRGKINFGVAGTTSSSGLLRIFPAIDLSVTAPGAPDKRPENFECLVLAYAGTLRHTKRNSLLKEKP